MIAVQCDQCDARFVVDDDKAMTKVRCPHCPAWARVSGRTGGAARVTHPLFDLLYALIVVTVILGAIGLGFWVVGMIFSLIR